ncbi:MAG: VWA domain-containing protein [Gammaproteobacteria bacterium]|nr:VWA domain-containing protein [Gammaproteobacteria bacterium]
MALKALAAFHFLYPQWLLAIPALLLIAAWYLWRGRRVGRWAEILDADLLAALRLEDDKRTASPWVPIAAAWVLAALALAGPAWRRVESAAYRTPADWVIALDLSPSMNATDVSPSRVMRAHYLIEDLVRAAKDARVGLVVFAGEAHTVVPLTTDSATINALLQPLVPSIMPESGDQAAPALTQAESLLRQTGSRAGRVILLTDGFDDPVRAFAAARALHGAGAVVDVVGIGSASGAPEPDGSGGFKRNAAGAVLVSKLPVDLLRRLAAAGGGRYWQPGDLDRLIASLHAGRDNPLAQTGIATAARVDAWRNEGYWLLPPLLLIAAGLARRGWL